MEMKKRQGRPPRAEKAYAINAAIPNPQAAGGAPLVMVTRPPNSQVTTTPMESCEHRGNKWFNNRIENAHQPTLENERPYNFSPISKVTLNHGIILP